MSHVSTFEETLTALADKQADTARGSADLVEPEALTKHLRFALMLAGLSLIGVVVLLTATRMLPLTDKQVVLMSVVGLAAAGLCFMALLSAGSTAGAAFARQRVALHKARQETAYAKFHQRQSELDAIQEAAMSLQSSVAWQVGADVLWAELIQKDRPHDPATLEEVYAYMRCLSACTQGDVDLLEDRVRLAQIGQQVFQRYEVRVQGSLVQQPAYQAMKRTFGDLRAA